MNILIEGKEIICMQDLPNELFAINLSYLNTKSNLSIREDYINYAYPIIPIDSGLNKGIDIKIKVIVHHKLYPNDELKGELIIPIKSINKQQYNSMNSIYSKWVNLSNISKSKNIKGIVKLNLSVYIGSSDTLNDALKSNNNEKNNLNTSLSNNIDTSISNNQVEYNKKELNINNKLNNNVINKNNLFEKKSLKKEIIQENSNINAIKQSSNNSLNDNEQLNYKKINLACSIKNFNDNENNNINNIESDINKDPYIKDINLTSSGLTGEILNNVDSYNIKSNNILNISTYSTKYQRLKYESIESNFSYIVEDLKLIIMMFDNFKESYTDYKKHNNSLTENKNNNYNDEQLLKYKLDAASLVDKKIDFYTSFCNLFKDFNDTAFKLEKTNYNLINEITIKNKKINKLKIKVNKFKLNEEKKKNIVYSSNNINFKPNDAFYSSLKNISIMLSHSSLKENCPKINNLYDNEHKLIKIFDIFNKLNNSVKSNINKLILNNITHKCQKIITNTRKKEEKEILDSNKNKSTGNVSNKNKTSKPSNKLSNKKDANLKEIKEEVEETNDIAYEVESRLKAYSLFLNKKNISWKILYKTKDHLILNINGVKVNIKYNKYSNEVLGN